MPSDTLSKLKMSATTSPQKDKVSWVKFENETEANVEPEANSQRSMSSSGVSSARGSVNSVQLSPHEIEAKDEADRGVLVRFITSIKVPKNNR